MKYYFQVFSFVFVLLVSGCSSDDDYGPKNTGSTEDQEPVNAENRKAFVLNEGNFMHGNASLDVYDLDDQKMMSGVFENANGSKLGDVAQSGVLIGDTLAVVLNNSAKIVLLNKNDYTLIDELAGLNSPRYLAKMPNGNFLLTELYADRLYEVDFNSMQVLREFALDGWTDEVFVTDQNVAFVRNVDHKSLDIYDLNAQSLQKRLGEGQVTGVCFGEGEVYALTNFGVMVVNYGDNEASTTVLFDDTLSTRRPGLYEAGNRLYFLANGIYALDLPSGNVEHIVESGGRNFYGLSVDPLTGDVFVTDAKDYAGRGTFYRFDKLGNKLDEKTAGIIPQAIIF